MKKLPLNKTMSIVMIFIIGIVAFIVAHAIIGILIEIAVLRDYLLYFVVSYSISYGTASGLIGLRMSGKAYQETLVLFIFPLASFLFIVLQGGYFESWDGIEDFYHSPQLFGLPIAFAFSIYTYKNLGKWIGKLKNKSNQSNTNKFNGSSKWKNLN